jgi:hypothetical protein
VGDSKGELRHSDTFFYRLTGRIIRRINEFSGKKDKRNNVVRNEKIHYTCLERYHLIKKYRPLNLTPAIEQGTDFEPVKDKWQPEWLQYLLDVTNSVIHPGSNKASEKVA